MSRDVTFGAAPRSLRTKLIKYKGKRVGTITPQPGPSRNRRNWTIEIDPPHQAREVVQGTDQDARIAAIEMIRPLFIAFDEESSKTTVLK